MRLRKLLVPLLVLAALLLLLDRGAALVAGRVVARQAQSSGALSERPDVQLRGVPFLTQVLAGRYRDVRLSTRGDVGGAKVERLDVRLTGVRLPLRDVLSGRVGDIPVEGLRGSALLSYRYLSQQAGHGLTVSPAGDRLRVTGSTEVLGQRVGAAATSSVRLDGDRVVVRAQQFGTGSGAADALLNSTLGDRFDFSVPVGRLPYGLRLTGLRVLPSGVALTATGGPTVLRR